MRLTRFSLCLLLALLACFPAPTAPVFACSCILPDPPPTAFANIDAVFVGRVTQINNPGLPGLVSSSADPVRAVFQVNDSWKGVTTSIAVIETAVSSASCGYTFAVGQQYVVYAYITDGVWGTNICTRTSDVANATTDLTYLNTLPKLALVPTSSSVPVAVYVIGAVAVLALVAGGIWLVRRFQIVTSEEG